ncbi:MAG TPA: hypothetical protein VFK78_03080 [Gemmatimonadales bacterium]|nr:hypothetical protein [Gemmatimonadales bacterium]
MLRRVSFAVFLVLAPAGVARAQSLRDQIRTDLFTFGNCGEPLCLAGSLGAHGGHFIPSDTSSSGSMLTLLGTALSQSVSNVPVSATSAGVTYSFVGGLPVKTSTSGGPIFGERAQTLGKGRWFIGANVTAMNFQRLRGIPMNEVTFNFTHADVSPSGPTPNDTLGSPEFENDVVQVKLALNISVLVTTFVASYGLVDGVDLSVAVPVVHTSVQGTSVATIIPFDFPTPHFFAGDATNPVLTAVSGMDGSASGLGDISARLKVNVVQSGDFGVSVLGDARFPTGDENNLLGAGAFSGRGLAIASARFGTITPHLNFGYAFRDAKFANNSILATGGFDNQLSGWATMAFELMSEWELGASKLKIPGVVHYLAPFPHTVTPTNIPDQQDNFLNASMGFKFQTPKGILITTNALFPLRNSGLEPAVVWTSGLEYSF